MEERGLIWIRKGTNGRQLWRRQWPFRCK